MRIEHFNSEMNRLVSQFGKAAYSPERAQVIWKEVKDLSDAWMTRTVDKFIGEMRQAPLMQEFRTEISFERERTWAYEKRKHSEEAKRAYQELMFDDQIRASICKTIGDRLAGRMPDKVFTDFVQGIEKLTSLPRCKSCEGEGLVFLPDDAGYEWVYRCYCTAGDKKPAQYPRIKYGQLKAVT